MISTPARVSILLGCLAIGSSAFAADRPVDRILTDIRAVELPKPPSDPDNRAAVEDFKALRRSAMNRRAALIGELHRSYPAAAELPPLLIERWQLLALSGRSAEARVEAAEVAKGKDDKLVAEALFFRVFLMFQSDGPPPRFDDVMPAIEDFLKRAPKDDRGELVLTAAAEVATDPAKREAILKRLERDYPNSPTVRMIVGERRLRDGVGKPFPIAFNDAIKGTKVDASTLKGKVVVVDFWATWCPPCVAAMPGLKELYAKYKDKGVEFIGVNQDAPREEGGFDKLKGFVLKNGIDWPQYYEGKPSAQDFAIDWGVTAFPTVFVIDADGNLFSADAEGQLEVMIPELLAKARKAKAKR